MCVPPVQVLAREGELSARGGSVPAVPVESAAAGVFPHQDHTHSGEGGEGDTHTLIHHSRHSVV